MAQRAAQTPPLNMRKVQTLKEAPEKAEDVVGACGCRKRPLSKKASKRLRLFMIFFSLIGLGVCCYAIVDFMNMDDQITALVDEAKAKTTNVFLPRGSWPDLMQKVVVDESLIGNNFEGACAKVTAVGGGGLLATEREAEVLRYVPDSYATTDPIGPFSLEFAPNINADKQRYVFIASLVLDAVSFGVFGVFLTIVATGCLNCAGDPWFEKTACIADVTLWAVGCAMFFVVIIVGTMPIEVKMQGCLNVFDLTNQYGEANGADPVPHYVLPVLVNAAAVDETIKSDPFLLKTWDDSPSDDLSEPYSYLNFDFTERVCGGFDDEAYLVRLGIYSPLSSQFDRLLLWRVCSVASQQPTGDAGCLCTTTKLLDDACGGGQTFKEADAATTYVGYGGWHDNSTLTCSEDVSVQAAALELNVNATCKLATRTVDYIGSNFACPLLSANTDAARAWPGCTCTSNDGLCASSNTSMHAMATTSPPSGVAAAACYGDASACALQCTNASSSGGGVCAYANASTVAACRNGTRGCACLDNGVCTDRFTACVAGNVCANIPCVATSDCAPYGTHLACLADASGASPSFPVLALDGGLAAAAGAVDPASGVCLPRSRCANATHGDDAAGTACRYGEAAYTCNGFIVVRDGAALSTMVQIIRDEVNQGYYFNSPLILLDTFVIVLQYGVLLFLYWTPEDEAFERRRVIALALKAMSPRSRREARTTGHVDIRHLRPGTKAHRLYQEYEAKAKKRKSMSLKSAANKVRMANIATAPAASGATSSLANAANAFASAGGGKKGKKAVKAQQRGQIYQDDGVSIDIPADREISLTRAHSRRHGSGSRGASPPPLPGHGYDDVDADYYDNDDDDENDAWAAYERRQQQQQQQQQRAPPLPHQHSGRHQHQHHQPSRNNSQRDYYQQQQQQQYYQRQQQQQQQYYQQQPPLPPDDDALYYGNGGGARGRSNSRGSQPPPLPDMDPGDRRSGRAPPPISAPSLGAPAEFFR